MGEWFDHERSQPSVIDKKSCKLLSALSRLRCQFTAITLLNSNAEPMNLTEAQKTITGPATMHDVAGMAGVSIKSVSRVINREPYVSDKLRAKVEAAITALDYVPDLAARSLAGARSFEIGVLTGEMGPSYNSQVIAGVYRACVEHQHHLRIDTIPHDASGKEIHGHLERILHGSRCDGYVLVPPYCEMTRLLDMLDARNIRYSLMSPEPGQTRAPSVLMDDVAAARQVAELFWKLGHRRIGLVAGRKEHRAAKLRREGFLDRLREFDPKIEVTESDGAFMFDKGIEAGLDLLSRTDRPTAVFALNDDSAAGVIAACNQLGLKVPDQVSVAGFDDSWVAKSVWPHLTTVHQPVEAMAHDAACMLIDRSANGKAPEVRTLAFELIERNSTGPVP
jgi:LacI family transcriptional regulator